MGTTTRDRILDEALELFAENGYKGTNLRDLAARLGLSKSALYKHFSGKEDIWNSMLDRLEAYYSEHFRLEMPENGRFRTGRELYEATMNMIRFTVSDRRIVLTRKLLMTEQFRDERVRNLATAHFLEGTLRYFTAAFKKMKKDGIFERSRPEQLALMYTAPITALIHLCDREPEMTEAAIERADDFIQSFIIENAGAHQFFCPVSPEDD